MPVGRAASPLLAATLAIAGCERTLAFEGLAAIVGLTLAGWLVGSVARRFGKPAVVFELLLGLALGPTLLGRIAPPIAAWFHPTSPAAWALVRTASRVGLVLYVLGAGAEIDRRALRDRRRAVVPIGVAAFALPLVAGVAVGTIDGWERPDRLPRAIFLGVALSVSALPVIARTLADLALLTRPFGAAILGAVVVTDVLAWTTLGLVVAFAIPSDRGNLAALVADSVLLAFVVGLMLPARWRQPLAAPPTAPFGFLRTAGAILYFTTAGLGLDLLTAVDLRFTSIVLAVATAAKLAGGFLGARIAGIEPRTAAAVGAATNARGAMEIVIATTGLELGLADERTFAALVLLAILTSIATAPMLRRLAPDAELTVAGSTDRTADGFDRSSDYRAG